MNRRQWSQPVDFATAHARARGRYRFNRARQIRALERRALVAQVSLQLLQKAIAAGESFRGRPLWGKQVLIAEALGIHPSTVSRYIKRTRELALLFAPCPTCGVSMPRHELETRVSDLATKLGAALADCNRPPS